MDSVKAILGATQVGGGRMKMKNKNKGGNNNTPLRYKFDCTCFNDKKPSSTQTLGNIKMNYPSSSSIPFYDYTDGTGSSQSSLYTGSDPVSQTYVGGKQSKQSKYKKYLDNLNVPKLQSIARNKGIKITMKKNNKTVYCTKATLVKKLFNFKFRK